MPALRLGFESWNSSSLFLLTYSDKGILDHKIVLWFWRNRMFSFIKTPELCCCKAACNIRIWILPCWVNLGRRTRRGMLKLYLFKSFNDSTILRALSVGNTLKKLSSPSCLKLKVVFNCICTVLFFPAPLHFWWGFIYKLDRRRY